MLRLKTQNIQLAPLKMASRHSTTKASQNTAALKIAALTTGLLWAAVGGACSNNPHDFDMDDNVLIGAITKDPDTLDPGEAGDARSISILSNMYGRAYQFSYFGNKYELKPDLAEEMGTWGTHSGVDLEGKPLPSHAGKPTYTITIKKGLKFQNDICLDPSLEAPKTRSITAEDFAYSIRRQADPSFKAAGTFLVNSILGIDDYRKTLRKQLEKHGKVDPRTPFASVDTPNPHTLRITVDKKNTAIEYLFVTWFASPVPAECVNYYNGQGNREPFRQIAIASGPYKLQEWQHGHSLLLVRNENYHEEFYPPASVGTAAEKKKGLFRDSGKKMPFIDKVFYRIFAQPVPMWLAFEQGYVDAMGVLEFAYNQVVFENTLTDRYKERGIRLEIQDDPVVFYLLFNMRDSVVGGYTPNKNKLRQALSLAVPRKELIDILLNGRGKTAQSPVPPGIAGHDESYTNPFVRYDLRAAKKLLAESGYPKGIDPSTQQPLKLEFLYPAGSNPTMARFFKKHFDELGIDFKITAVEWYALLAKQKKGQFQVSFGGWGADYPDAENFMQLFYGKNAGTKLNSAHYTVNEFDALYLELKQTFDPVKKVEIVSKMNEILNGHMPWIYLFSRTDYMLFPSWLENMQPHPMTYAFTKYRKINGEMRAAYVSKYNEPQYWVIAVVLSFVLVGVFWARQEKKRMQ